MGLDLFGADDLFVGASKAAQTRAKAAGKRALDASKRIAKRAPKLAAAVAAAGQKALSIAKLKPRPVTPKVVRPVAPVARTVASRPTVSSRLARRARLGQDPSVTDGSSDGSTDGSGDGTTDQQLDIWTQLANTAADAVAIADQFQTVLNKLPSDLPLATKVTNAFNSIEISVVQPIQTAISGGTSDSVRGLIGVVQTLQEQQSDGTGIWDVLNQANAWIQANPGAARVMTRTSGSLQFQVDGGTPAATAPTSGTPPSAASAPGGTPPAAASPGGGGGGGGGPSGDGGAPADSAPADGGPAPDDDYAPDDGSDDGDGGDVNPDDSDDSDFDEIGSGFQLLGRGGGGGHGGGGHHGGGFRGGGFRGGGFGPWYGGPWYGPWYGDGLDLLVDEDDLTDDFAEAVARKVKKKLKKTTVGAYDLGAARKQMDALKKVPFGAAHILVRRGMEAINTAFANAKQPWYKFDLPGDTTRKNVQSHLQWHADKLAALSNVDPTSMYDSGADLKEWVLRAFVEENATEEGAADATWSKAWSDWEDMWVEIGKFVATLPKEIAKAVGGTLRTAVESALGIPVWVLVLGGVVLLGGLGYGLYKLLAVAAPVATKVAADRYLP